MKRIILSLAILLAVGLQASWSQSGPKPSKKNKKTNNAMFLESESQFGFDETVERLTTEIANRSWKLSATHDLQQVLKANGTDVLPIKVLALCHPKHSSKILALDDERIVSSLMPCRISVYNKSNGKTYVSRLNTSVLAPSMEGITGQVMAESGSDVEAILQTVIKAK